MPPLLLATTCATQFVCERAPGTARERLPLAGHQRARPVLAPAHRHLVGGALGGDRRDCFEIPPPRAGKACLQPYEFRAHRGHSPHRTRLVLSRPVGRGNRAAWRGSSCSDWRWYTAPSEGREPGLPRQLGRAQAGAGALARAAAGRAGSPAPGGEPHPLHLLHDFRPEDHARPAERADRLGHGRGRAGLRSPAPGVGDERAGLGAPPPVAGGSAARPPLPRFPLSLALRPALTARSRRRACLRRPSCRPAAGPSSPRAPAPRAGAGVLRLLRGEGRHAAVQRRVPGRAGA